MSDAEAFLDLFLNGFTARDIASSLPSFDDTTAGKVILAATANQGIAIAGIRNSGRMAGWVMAADLTDSEAPPRVRAFEPDTVVSDTTPLHRIIEKLSERSALFVRTLGDINGVIRMGDIEKAPMRMWLFGLITITELRVTRLIDEACGDDAWQKYLSPGRVRLAHDLLEQRRKRNQQLGLLDCLQFADKGQIVARDEALRLQTRFVSRSALEKFVKRLQDLRNNLAHSQDISSNWDVIRELAANVDRIVVGPFAAPPRSATPEDLMETSPETTEDQP